LFLLLQVEGSSHVWSFRESSIMRCAARAPTEPGWQADAGPARPVLAAA
jgi:hypothetical protein